MADWSERGLHLLSNRIGIVVRVCAFVVFFCVVKIEVQVSGVSY
jgi:hypothetical protein